MIGRRLAGFSLFAVLALFGSVCSKKQTPFSGPTAAAPTPQLTPTATPQTCHFLVSTARFDPIAAVCPASGGSVPVRLTLNLTVDGAQTINITNVRYLDLVCRSTNGFQCALPTNGNLAYDTKSVEPRATAGLVASVNLPCSRPRTPSAVEVSFSGLRIDSSCGTVAAPISNVFSLTFD